MVLMMALSNGAATPSLDPDNGYATAARYGNHLLTQVEKKGCKGCKGCNGCYGGYNCHGCYGGYSYGCHGGYAYGCGGGCYGGHAYGHAYGGWSSGGYAGAPGGYGYSSGYFEPSDMQYAPGDIQNPRNERRRDQRRDGSRDEEQESTGPARATITVRLPADARLTIDGEATRSTSDTRSFVTPPLERDKDFHYTLEARVLRDGKPVTMSKRVTVRAGEETQVSLDASSGNVAQR